MKVLARSRYGAAQTALGGLDPIASGLPWSCGRGRPFLMEQADDNRLRYYKGGQRRASAVPTIPRTVHVMVGTLRCAHPCISALVYPDIVP